jgi:geranylgeranyl diphosphate synthase type II
MHTFQDIQKLVKEQIDHLQVIKEPRLLYEPIQYTMESGGKRIRPSFVLMGYQLFEDNLELVLPLASSIEVFHNFTLLHDDIMDKAAVRRGKPTVHQKWNENVAILSGDAMSIKAYELLTKYEGSYFREILRLFNQTALEVCEGQQLDMNFEERNDVSEEEYLQMIELKTAALLAGSLKMGALAAGASDEDVHNLSEFGRFLGLSFQLQDDYLDLYGDPKVFGKKIGGDIVANKKTYLLIKALEKTTPKDREKLQKLMASKGNDNDEKIQRVKAVFDSYHIAESTTEKIQAYYKLSQQHLQKIDVDEMRKSPLNEVSEMLMKRNK